MRVAYIECFAGIAGDMMLGALIDAGVPVHVLERATTALGIGASLRMERVDRSGISCTKVHVLEASGALAEAAPHSHGHQDAQAHDHEHEAIPQQAESAGATLTHQPRTQHLHKVGHVHEHPREHVEAPEHSHSHEHAHTHGRSLTVIRELISAAPLEDPVKRLAIHAFELLGESEARIHNVPVEDIHFHEVGAVDAIVDIVASSAGLHHLKIDKWFCSPLNVGGGMVQCAHGNFPVPAPATADLLRGVPTYSAHVQKELVTPTGAALVRALAPEFGAQPAMRVEHIGYGAGTRNPAGFPNVLRLSIGEMDEIASEIRQPQEARSSNATQDLVTVLETALDDLSAQVLAFVAEKALAMGALDVMLAPVTMKKGRPGTLLTILCRPADSEAMQRLVFRETSTLGIRVREERRVLLTRAHTTVETPYGPIRVKAGSDTDGERNLAPEFEDCRAAAEERGVPLKQVQQAAIAAYLGTR